MQQKTVEGKPVLQSWVTNLSFMQQSVLLTAIRGPDGMAKGHPAKDLIRWYRRCVLLSAFDGRALTSPKEPGGGSFTGPIGGLTQAENSFIRARDEMTLHYYCHAMHAFEIVGYKHPDNSIRTFWYQVYVRMVHALHLWTETEQEMDLRLGDSIDQWKEREDCAGGCST